MIISLCKLSSPRKKFKTQGFTLIELLIVIAIITILAAVVAPNAFRAIENSKITKALGDVDTFRKASLAYYADVGKFPIDIGPGGDPGFNTTSPLSGIMTQNDVLKWQGPYLDMNVSGGWLPKNPWGGVYDYECWTATSSSSAWQKEHAGIWITIRGINIETANKLIEKASYDYMEDDPSDDNSSGDPSIVKVSFRVVKAYP